MLLTRDQALKVGKRSFATVTIDELDGELRLVSVSAATLMKVREYNQRSAATPEMMKLVLQRSIVDEKGEPLFDTAGVEDFFDRVSIETINKILGAVPGLTPEKKDAKDAAVDPAVPAGNSEAAPTAA